MASTRERLRPEERRQKLIDTAIELADTVGLDRLTSRDVAQALGVTSGLVHHYFPTVDDLIAAAFEQFARARLAQERQLVEDSPPAEALRTYVRLALDTSSSTARMWMSAWVTAPRRPALAAAVDEQMLAGLRVLTTLLEEGTAAGVFRVEDAQTSAFRILVLVDGVLIQVSMLADTIYGDVPSLIWDTVEREVGLPAGSLR